MSLRGEAPVDRHDHALATGNGSLQASIRIKGIDRLLAPGAYEVITDDEMIEGLSLPWFRRVAPPLKQ